MHDEAVPSDSYVLIRMITHSPILRVSFLSQTALQSGAEAMYPVGYLHDFFRAEMERQATRHHRLT